jgi:hypothetical protein
MDENEMKEFFETVKPHLNEKVRRIVTAGAAIAAGQRNISKISRASGMAREVIRTGIKEIKDGVQVTDGEGTARIRRPGGGRKKVVQYDSELLADLHGLIDPATRGDPESPLLWTSKSLRHLERELRAKGHDVSHVTIGALLKSQGFSLQANFKALDPKQHEDRDAQFLYIYSNIKETQRLNQPVISVDTKKKELVGEFKNNGREWEPKGNPTKVLTHDFEDKALGHAIPFGVYDITENQGWVSVGITHDTSQFAVSSIRNWWYEMGKEVYPYAEELMITADSGGSNGYRRKLWKKELQDFADDAGLILHVLHFPPNTSKWNKIEHRMFSFISKNWRGKPLVSLEVIISLIANTTTDSGLKIKCAIDSNNYETGIKVTDEEMAGMFLIPDEYHGEWNYRLFPRKYDNVIS